MPKIIERVSVTVRDSGPKGETRSVVIEVSGENALFQLSDLLSKEGVIESLEKSLKQATKEATLRYIESGKTFLKSFTPPPKKGPKSSKKEPEELPSLMTAVRREPSQKAN